MRSTAILVLLISLTLLASAALAGDDLIIKSTETSREGGETYENPVHIGPLPYQDSGDTSDNIDNFDLACPDPSDSPDVVYAFSPLGNQFVDICLGSESYDTKLYVALYLEPNIFILQGCNDDYEGPDSCGLYTSRIDSLYLETGNDYLIFVDGSNGESGTYTLEVIQGEGPAPINICNLIQDATPGQTFFTSNTCDAENLIDNAQCYGVPIVSHGNEHVYAFQVPPGCVLTASVVFPQRDAVIWPFSSCVLEPGWNACGHVNESSVGDVETFGFNWQGDETIYLWLVVDTVEEGCGDYELTIDSDCATVPVEIRSFGAVKAIYR
jgi:hypothetical protein